MLGRRSIQRTTSNTRGLNQKPSGVTKYTELRHGILATVCCSGCVRQCYNTHKNILVAYPLNTICDIKFWRLDTILDINLIQTDHQLVVSWSLSVVLCMKCSSVFLSITSTIIFSNFEKGWRGRVPATLLLRGGQGQICGSKIWLFLNILLDKAFIAPLWFF